VVAKWLKLQELKTVLKKFSIKHSLYQRLIKIDSAQEVYDEVKNKSIVIDYLINNASWRFGMFTDTNWKKKKKK
jgi:short-subunit dehydrogenase